MQECSIVSLNCFYCPNSICAECKNGYSFNSKGVCRKNCTETSLLPLCEECSISPGS